MSEIIQTAPYATLRQQCNGSNIAIKAGCVRTKVKLGEILKSSTLYCHYCDCFSSPFEVRVKNAQSNICNYYTCRHCAEIICPVPAPILVGIETNPGPGRGRRRGHLGKRPNMNRGSFLRAGERVSQYTAAPIQNRKFRFQCGTAGTYNLTEKELGLLLGVAGGVNTFYSLYSSFKLNRVQVWSSGNSGDLKLDPIGLNFFTYSGSTYIPTKRWTDYGNANHFAYLSHQPPKDSLASFWSSGISSNILFQLSVNVGDIIDLDLSMICDGNFSAASYTSTGAMVPGNFYSLALDNQGSSHLPPSESDTII